MLILRGHISLLSRLISAARKLYLKMRGRPERLSKALLHTTSEECENGGFAWKTHQMFSVYTTKAKFKNVTILVF